MRRRLPLVAVNRPEQLAHARRLGDRSVVFLHDWRQCGAQADSGVVLCPAGRNGQVEDATQLPLHAVRRVVNAGGLDAPKNGQEVRGV